jgi:hypothetical protein
VSDHVLPPPPDYLTPEQLKLFDRLSDRVVKMRMTVPAMLFLESTRPLNFIGSQAMLFFAPMVHALFAAHEYNLLQQALERRETLGYLADLLEAKEQVESERERAEKQVRKAAKERKRTS